MAVPHSIIAEYRAWTEMKRRCLDPRRKEFKNYGGRGIKVCERWSTSFRNFLADMGPRPSPQATLDRADNQGDYEPGNCRWVSMKVQQRNRRNNHRLTHDGQTLTIAEWAEKTGLNKRTILERILYLSWPVERALTVPARAPRKRGTDGEKERAGRHQRQATDR